MSSESGYDIENLLQEAQTRWLKPGEVLFILTNHEKLYLAAEPHNKPPSGSVFLFNKRVLRFFRTDGHSWLKKKDRRTTLEAHERIKVENVEALNCYYAYGEHNVNFQRRIYWMLDPAYEHIVFVHYREVNEGLYPLLQRLELQLYINNMRVSDSNVFRSLLVCHSSGLDNLLNFGRLKHLTSNNWESNLINTLRGSILKLPWLCLKELNCLLWSAYPLRSLSLNFHAENFVELNLSYRNGALYAGTQDFVSLKLIHLRNCNFSTMPNLSRAYKLMSLDLQGCINLVEVSSIQHLTNLEYLNLEGCTSLRSLPSLMGLTNLCSINLSDCLNVTRLPLSLGCLCRLQVLDLRNCIGLQKLPISTFRLKSLQSLNISGCSQLMKHTSGNPMDVVPSSVVRCSVGSSLFQPDSFSLGSISSNISYKKRPQELQDNQVTDSFFFVPEGGANVEEQIGVLSLPATLSLNQSVNQQSLKRSLEQVKEEGGGGNTSNSEEKIGHKRRTSSEVELQHSLTPGRGAMPFITELDADVGRGFIQQTKALTGYMNKSVEAIHEADALKDIENLCHLLIHQTSILKNGTNLEDLSCCKEEFKETIPNTMIYMNAAQTYRTSLQVELARIGVSLLQAQEQYSSLEAELTSLSEEEANLDAEIQRLVAKKDQLLNRKNCKPPP